MRAPAATVIEPAFRSPVKTPVGDKSTCGSVVELANDILTIKTSTGQTPVDLEKATAMRADRMKA